jgi:defect-in-organelle-trafficking protein DotB
MSQYDPKRPETLFIPIEVEQEFLAGVNTKLLRLVMLHVFKINASDLLVQDGFPIRVKLNNLVFPISRGNATLSIASGMIKIITNNDDAVAQIMSANPVKTTYKFRAQVGGVKRGIRFRIHAIKDGENGIQMSCRLNNDEIHTLAEIGHTPKSEIYQNMFPQKGLVLVTGATDSGKTTFLYACLRHLIESDERSAVINTYESPIEGDLRIVAKKAKAWNISVSQTQVPDGVKTFGDGIEESLRRNSDIILVGELRTKDEVVAALDATIQTGRNILATLHSSNLPSTLNRMINVLGSVGESEKKARVYDLIESLHMIFSQTLLTTLKAKRTAVYEYLIFTREIKQRLHSVLVEDVSKELSLIMTELGRTMTVMAERKLADVEISQEVFDRFKASYSY